MIWYQIFVDGPEYETRKRKRFVPPNVTIKDIRDAVPKHLFVRSTSRSMFYLFRHLAVTYLIYVLGQRIDPWTFSISPPLIRSLVRVMMWLFYWGWQGFAFAGIWCLVPGYTDGEFASLTGHEAGHDALSEYAAVNTIAGMVLHTFVLTPYYAWRATHRTHHKSTNQMERDETYMPATRSTFKLPDGKVAVPMDYASVLEETPAFTLFKLVIRQFFGFQLYLLHNRKGNPKYPRWTSHYRPSSLLFRPEERQSIVISNIAIGCMLTLLGIYIRSYGWSNAMKHYFGPWLFQHNWMVMFTYLQHSDPTIPYYRRKEWNFARGALATVDRPLFGWVGKFFLHNISTDHLAHHFFSSVPFYNLPQVTQAIKPVLGEYYNYDSTGVLHALWRSFTQCVFVEDEGDILFFKNKYGQTVLQLEDEQLGSSE